MRSFFPEIGGLGALALLLLAGGAGCDQVVTEQTNIKFLRSPGGAPSCTGAGGTSAGRAPTATAPAVMDTYIVQVFELTDLTDQSQAACDTCFASGSNCFLEKTTCFCGGPTPADWTLLPQELSGMRVQVSDYESAYCTRLLAVDRASQIDAPTAACQCQDSWSRPAALQGNARLCAASSPYAISPLDVYFPVQCPADGQAFSICLGL
jgi:hypothetical protein